MAKVAIAADATVPLTGLPDADPLAGMTGAELMADGGPASLIARPAKAEETQQAAPADSFQLTLQTMHAPAHGEKPPATAPVAQPRAASEVTAAVKAPARRLEVSVDDETLGPVTVSAVMRGGGIHTVVSTPRPPSDMLQSSLKDFLAREEGPQHRVEFVSQPSQSFGASPGPREQTAESWNGDGTMGSGGRSRSSAEQSSRERRQIPSAEQDDRPQMQSRWVPAAWTARPASDSTLSIHI